MTDRPCATCGFVREPGHPAQNRNCCTECETSDGKYHSYACTDKEHWLRRLAWQKQRAAEI